MFALPKSRRTRRGLALTLAVAALTLAAQGAATPAQLATANVIEGQPRDNALIEWNRPPLDTMRTPYAQPATVQPPRNLAIMSTATEGALNATSHAHPAYGVRPGAPRDASLPAPATPGRSATAGTAAGITVAVRDSRLGKILVDGQGRTLYLFEADKDTKSTCYGACAKTWPPLTTTGKPQAGSGVSSALLGTAARADRTIGVTYNGHPLYYFITDKKPGDITGQDLNSFGAKWFVLSPNGNKITKD